MSKRMVEDGTVVYQWSKEDSECICCGTPDVPHKHNFSRYIRFDDLPDSDPVHAFLNRFRDIEGRRVRVTIEIIEDEEEEEERAFDPCPDCGFDPCICDYITKETEAEDDE